MCVCTHNVRMRTGMYVYVYVYAYVYENEYVCARVCACVSVCGRCMCIGMRMGIIIAYVRLCV